MHLLRERLHGQNDSVRKRVACAVLAAAAAAAVPASAVTVPVTLAGPAAKTAVVLTLAPSGASPQGETLPARTLAATTPGVAAVDLPAGSRWSLTVHAPRLWARTQVFEAVAGTELAIRLLPAGTVRATIEVAPGESLPSELSLRLTPPPDGPAAEWGRSASEVCAVRDGEIACAAPAGALDLRLRARGFVSQYWRRVRKRSSSPSSSIRPSRSRSGSIRRTIPSCARGRST